MRLFNSNRKEIRLSDVSITAFYSIFFLVLNIFSFSFIVFFFLNMIVFD